MFESSLPVENQSIERYAQVIKGKSDRAAGYFIWGFFIVGLILAFFYDTWVVAVGIGGMSLVAFYGTKALLPESKLYQYVLAVVLAVYMAQYIYQMHGMFEMHFIAFIASAMLITYQEWKLQIPLAITVVVHHGAFGLMQYWGVDNVYFTQLNYMNLQTFVIHILLAATVFGISGLWAYQFRKYGEAHIGHSYEIGKLSEERNQALAMAKVSHKLRDAQAIAKLGHWNWNLKSNVLEGSEELHNIFETSKGDISPDKWSMFNQFAADDMKEIQALAKYSVQHGEAVSYECGFTTPSGIEKIVRIQIKPIVINGETIEIQGVTQDVTEQRLTQRKLDTAYAELNRLFNTINEVLFTIDMQTKKVLQVSPACVEMYGYKPEDFYKDADFWRKLIYEEDRVVTEAQLAELAKGRSVHTEYRIMHKSGDLRWVQTTLIPTVSDMGILLKLDGVTSNITERKIAENELYALNEQLELKVEQRTAELEAANKEMESFSYSVSHDLRAPLRVIYGYSTILQRSLKDKLSSADTELWQEMLGNVKQMNQLIDDLLHFSRLGRAALQTRMNDMRNIVRTAIEEVKIGAGDFNYEILFNEPQYTNCDSSLMKQVWVNLLSNAVKYSSKKENPKIEIGSKVENNVVTYFVKDNGAGFDMKYADKLFGVFQRLHRSTEYEGTGVGLALTDRIVRKHGGKIWADAKVDEGATFYFNLQSNN